VFVQPSSLVFLVIIAVWAAYFVQYWVRRREHLATARSVDQFSESMRVLERRSPLPASNLSTPPPRSYAVTPARAARPQVLVKRAETAQAGVSAPREADRSATRWVTAPPGGALTQRSDAVPANPAVARRNRALIMLGALSTVVVAVPLVALSLLPALTLLVPVVSVGGAVAWARAAAQAERRSRRVSRPARAERPAQSRPSASRVAVEPEVAPVAEVPVADAEPVVAPQPAKPELFDFQAAAPATVESAVTPEAVSVPARPLVDEDDIPLTWDPVPVPRPTYTMKSRVTRPAPTAADLVGDADTEYAAYEDVPERRVAGA
jgi:membrane protein implicated in regulation of membrane protease activity